jgi:hypothetical protein
MANLVESSLWEPGIYQWETSDPVEGGANGKDNVPTRQLANRTRWLLDNLVRNAGAVPSVQAGTGAARPAAGTAGRLYVVTDATPLPRIDRDTGTAWTEGVGGPQFGANANGQYLRWENGVQLCWGRVIGFGELESRLNSVAWTYPAAFVDVPIVLVAGASNFNGTPVLATSFNPWKTGTTVFVHMPNGRPNYTSAECAAVGRWK